MKMWKATLQATTPVSLSLAARMSAQQQQRENSHAVSYVHTPHFTSHYFGGQYEVRFTSVT